MLLLHPFCRCCHCAYVISLCICDLKQRPCIPRICAENLLSGGRNASNNCARHASGLRAIMLLGMPAECVRPASCLCVAGPCPIVKSFVLHAFALQHITPKCFYTNNSTSRTRIRFRSITHVSYAACLQTGSSKVMVYARSHRTGQEYRTRAAVLRAQNHVRLGRATQFAPQHALPADKIWWINNVAVCAPYVLQ